MVHNTQLVHVQPDDPQQAVPIATAIAVPIHSSTPFFVDREPPTAQVMGQPSLPVVQAQAITIQPSYIQCGPRQHQYSSLRIHPDDGNPSIESNHHGRQPESYAVLAWFSCLCCCWPVGLVAVCASREVSVAYMDGDYERAERASRRARHIAICAIIMGVLFFIHTSRNGMSSQTHTNQGGYRGD